MKGEFYPMSIPDLLELVISAGMVYCIYGLNRK